MGYLREAGHLWRAEEVGSPRERSQGPLGKYTLKDVRVETLILQSVRQEGGPGPSCSPQLRVSSVQPMASAQALGRKIIISYRMTKP